jgi:hypothetical protein
MDPSAAHMPPPPPFMPQPPRSVPPLYGFDDFTSWMFGQHLGDPSQGTSGHGGQMCWCLTSNPTEGYPRGGRL